MDAALPRKHLKIYNLTTTNATLMKLTTIMYLHKMFNYAKDCKPKTPQNEPENQLFGLISGDF